MKQTVRINVKIQINCYVTILNCFIVSGLFLTKNSFTWETAEKIQIFLLFI